MNSAPDYWSGSAAADAVSDTRQELIAYQADHPEFRAIGDLMLAEWEREITVSRLVNEQL